MELINQILMPSIIPGVHLVIVRKLEIQNFRGIKTLSWAPAEGINCLLGQGDSSKTTILDAIDLCLGARRSYTFGDTDFYQLDVENPIVIDITLGRLPDALKNIETYGEFLRGFDASTCEIEDEPRAKLETVLTLRLSVSGDLEPTWLLYSDRAQSSGVEKSIAWKERSAIAPARIGSYGNSNLSWTRGSVLNQLTDVRTDLGAELAKAARDARTNFGAKASTQLADALKIVTDTAKSLGVPVGASAQALLDAHAVSISDGAIALHNEDGIPLRALGTGSSRLLIAGLQRAASDAASIALVDEVEYGLEPHRLTRLLHSLGSKDYESKLQVFMTTHSPIAIRELSGDQIFVVRSDHASHNVINIGMADNIQGTVREAPEAFLAKSILVCEGASEVGVGRGLDKFWQTLGFPSFFALGGAYVDVKGGDPNKALFRASVLMKLGYRVRVFIDADKECTQETLSEFTKANGVITTWKAPRALEDELFMSLPYYGVDALLNLAVDLCGDSLIDDHLKTISAGKWNLFTIREHSLTDGYTDEMRTVLAKAAKNKNNAWFKSISKYEIVANDIIGPYLSASNEEFVSTIEELRRWMHAT